MARVLRESGENLGDPNGPATATAFVIASDKARVQLDRTCIAGRGQWRDVWWEEAAREGILSIANHSWDHLHPTLDSVVAKNAERGRFDTVCNHDDADREIGDAERLLQERLGTLANGLFAYPYGQFNDYLVSEYLPGQSLIRAAFCCGGQYVSSASARWAIPRFTCQEHWQTPEDLREILRRA